MNSSEVIEKYRGLDVTKWSYISQTVNGQDIKEGEKPFYNEDIFHVGVMAQDYHKAFGLGVKENQINALDVAGTNMSAIKELIALSDNQANEIAELKKQIAELKAIVLSK